MYFLKLLNIILLFVLIAESESILDWFFGSNLDDDSPTENVQADSSKSNHPESLQLRNSKFEMQTIDEKFAASGRDLIARMSELDKCHLLVVSELKSACTAISEEDLAKLGVALLNCQSQAEGRTVYPCNPDMTVAQCTKPMDPDTWNAYLIVSNRARSVCYSVRQQQFQRQTQFAVSQLASSAEDQLYLMEHLKQHQQELVSVAEETLEGMTQGHKEMMTAQESMKLTQTELQDGLAGSVETLMTEKALIAAGHKELAAMAFNISRKLDNANHQLSEQDIDRQQYRKDLMKDLARIQNRTKALIEQLDSNFNEVLSFQKGSSNYYQETLEKLLVVNQTVSFLLGTVGEMKVGIDQKLTWVTSLLGGAGNSLDLLVTCVFHACFFFLAAFILTFLGTPVTSRLLVIFLVPLNALAEINHGHSLDYPSLTIVIFTIVSANVGIQYGRHRSQSIVPPSPKECLTCRGGSPLKLSPIQPVLSAAATPEKDLADEVNVAKRNLSSVLESIPVSPHSAKNTSKVTPVSPQRTLCSGRTKIGQNCRLPSTKGSPFCHRHAVDK
ncbi:protein brambleberry-like isoform X2 [Apostichopus japonicus]|uniref:protein brambleberry-like isoform X2 n=1 Tax=Stichopus japonicus TaxID=307972 RepID=UPI003AB6A535